MKNNYQSRLKRLQKNLEPNAGYLIADPNDIRYLTGFVSLLPEEREALLLVTKLQAHLLYARFSPLNKIAGIQYYPGSHLSSLAKHFNHIFSNEIIQKIDLDSEHLYLNEFQTLEKVTQEFKIELSFNSPTTHLAMQRMVKDAQEIAYLSRAGKIAYSVWNSLQTWLKPGVTEQETARHLESLLLNAGSDQTAFPTIIAFGPHSSLPHHQPTSTKLTNNTPVLVDFGATYQGYRSDMTRTTWFGDTPNATFTQVQTIITKAYQAALKKSQVVSHQQITATNIDAAARSLITKAGYGEQFIHTTGHGLGLAIHEPPSLNWSNQTLLAPEMVITIEPGIYLEGAFGYRYENTILLGKSGSKELTL